MSDADFLRKLANDSKNTMTVAAYERLYKIALALEAAECDAEIIEAIIAENGVELTMREDSQGSFPSWTARKGKRIGYSHEISSTKIAYAALLAFARNAP